MAARTDLPKCFLSGLGQALVRHGFPLTKKALRYDFVQPTAAGLIGIFAQPIRHGDEIRFSLRTGVRIDRVQQVMEQTELFAPEARGETWSCGIMLENLEKYQDWIAPLGPVRARLALVGLGPRKGGYVGHDEEYMNVAAGDDVIKSQVDRVMRQIDALVMPFLRRYGQTEEAFLDLCLRDDDFADLCWLTFDRKILSGLVVARCLGRDDAIRQLKQIALRKGGYYARNGNPVPLERIERIGGALGLI